ncbi:MAG: hypothetical protein IJF33_00420 [Clostridia bacterium]|nr:hypothetical protein [Clostridia bacterium]
MKMTGYESLTSVQLYSLFSSDKWNGMNGTSRLAACQEVENRLASSRGTTPREVISEPMNGSALGYQSGDTIALNSHILDDGVFCTTYTDFDGNVQTRVTELPSPGWETFDTINHEDMHGVWEDRGVLPETYIQPNTDRDLYRIQGCEKAAFAAGEKNTLAAIKAVTLETGKLDPDAQIYLSNHLEGNDFAQSLENAARNYNDPHIEETLNTYISNSDQGIEPNEPSASYDAIDSLYCQQCYINYYGTNHSAEYAEEAVSVSQETVMDDGSQLDALENQSYETGYAADDGYNVEENGAGYDSDGYDASVSYGAVDDGAELGEGTDGYSAVGSYDMGYEA